VNIAVLYHYYRRLNLTNQEYTDDEKKERALKRLKELSENPTTQDVLVESLTEEQEEWLNKKFPQDPFNQVGDDMLDLSYDQWLSKHAEMYENLRQIVTENLPNLWDSLEFELSVQKILNIKDCTLPFAGIVLGRPSSLKTVGIEMFRTWKNSFYTDNFSAKAFVSHSTAVSREKLAEIDLLPKIRNKLFLTPELSPTFTKKDDDLIEILGILTRVLDGQGYESDTGAHGHRGYHGQYMFVWIGAAVDVSYKVHRHLGNLGAKLYFLRLPKIEKDEDEYLEQINKDDFLIKTNEIRKALVDYLEWFEKYPGASIENNIAKVPWNFEKDDVKTKRFIVRLGKLLAHLRGVVPTWETKDSESQGIDYAYAIANIEEPDRAIRQLTNLARGHALSKGRNYLNKEDISIVIRVVLSTASTERVRIFELLLNFGGYLTTRQIMDYLNTSAPTAKRTMAELKAIDLVTIETIQGDHGGDPQKQIILSNEFGWFLTDEFNDLKLSHRKNFSPLLPDNSDQSLEGGNFSCSGVANIIYDKYVVLNSVIPRTSDISVNSSGTTLLLKCPECKFKNIHPETIEHHIRYKHRTQEEKDITIK
jgi:hypothetical protein